MIKYRKFTDDEIKKICGSIIILIDKREKSTHVKEWCDHKSRCKYKDITLSQGDYSFYLEAMPEYGIMSDLYFDKDIVVERKNSLDEISQNMTKNRARFEEELAMFNGKMTIAIADTWDNLFQGKYKAQYDRKSFIASIMSFEHRYDVAFKFVSDEAFPVYIYAYFYYFLRELLKNGEVK